MHNEITFKMCLYDCAEAMHPFEQSLFNRLNFTWAVTAMQTGSYSAQPALRLEITPSCYSATRKINT